ncbi:hypothetical protein AAFF_G00340570 [Aldrovandia affinis]|uniref:Uncharacterized protein n=1 Tax=Aldrovandia affinis TaxID=143900 RepID=A0AAD7SKH1_9TELE|nr:hypothetical protein AAFF_G00340570 [Aldrovandia affinis]
MSLAQRPPALRAVPLLCLYGNSRKAITALIPAENKARLGHPPLPSSSFTNLVDVGRHVRDNEEKEPEGSPGPCRISSHHLPASKSTSGHQPRRRRSESISHRALSAQRSPGLRYEYETLVHRMLLSRARPS